MKSIEAKVMNMKAGDVMSVMHSCYGVLTLTANINARDETLRILIEEGCGEGKIIAYLWPETFLDIHSTYLSE